jgi:hypothetical protein
METVTRPRPFPLVFETKPFPLVFENGLKAYQQRNDPPFLGDIRPTIDYPPSTKLADVTSFEIFDGKDWVDRQTLANRTYIVEVSS